MSRVTVLCAAWLILLIGGWGVDFFLALRVPGGGAMLLSLIPLLLTRSRPLLITAAVLTPLALFSSGLARPDIWQDIEEVEGRVLAASLVWGAVAVGALQERWRRDALLGDVRLKALVDALPDVIWVGTPGAAVTTLHSGWAAFTGQHRAEALGEGWLAAVHAEDRARARELWLAPDPHAWPDCYDIEVRLWHEPSRGYRAVSISVRPLRRADGELLEWVGVFIDCHERKTSAATLAAHREQLHEAERLAQAGRWELDVASATVRISAELTEAFGGLPEASERPLAEALRMFVVDARDALTSELRRLIDEGGEHRGEYGVLLADGVRRVGELLVRSDRRADGSVVVWGTVQNVTARARARERQTELELQLFRSTRMHTVGELATGLAHDFNNVLATMIGFGELARKRVQGVDGQSRAYLDRVIEAGRRAGELVRTLMSFARATANGDPAGPAVIALAPVVHETLRLVRASVPDSIEIVADITADIHAPVERIYLQDALLNLCINARDALGTAGRLSVALSLQELRDTCVVCGERLRGAAAVLSVRDNGAGVDPAALPHIFEPFYSTKAEHQGAGMGLAMVAQLMHKNGGHIVVSSRRGDTRFALIFPGGALQQSEPRVAGRLGADFARLASAAGGSSEPGEARSADVGAGTSANARAGKETAAAPNAGATLGETFVDARLAAVVRQQVLVVDDEPSIGRLIASALEAYGLIVTVFVEPREAAAAYQLSPNRWDLLITDLTMPGMSGLELASLVRAVNGIPVLLLTGGGASDEELRSAGVIDQIMRKPFAMNEFVRVAAALLRDGAKSDPPKLQLRV